MSESDIRDFCREFDRNLLNVENLFSGTVRNVRYTYSLRGDTLNIDLNYDVRSGANTTDIKDFKNEVKRAADSAEIRSACIYSAYVEFVSKNDPTNAKPKSAADPYYARPSAYPLITQILALYEEQVEYAFLFYWLLRAKYVGELIFKLLLNKGFHYLSLEEFAKSGGVKEEPARESKFWTEFMKFERAYFAIEREMSDRFKEKALAYGYIDKQTLQWKEVSKGIHCVGSLKDNFTIMQRCASYIDSERKDIAWLYLRKHKAIDDKRMSIGLQAIKEYGKDIVFQAHADKKTKIKEEEGAWYESFVNDFGKK